MVGIKIFISLLGLWSASCFLLQGKRNHINLSTSLQVQTRKGSELDSKFEQVNFNRDSEFVTIEQDEIYPLIKTAVLAGNARKASGITAIRISHLTEITRFMVILEGTSRPQNQAIANAIEVRYMSLSFANKLYECNK